mgnify:CR=1 FL=1
MAERRIVLVRHGETTYNATGRMQGQLDTELSDVGIAQAALAHVADNPGDVFGPEVAQELEP